MKKYALLLWVLAMLGCEPKPLPTCTDCNVILVTIDTLRADHLGCYGYARNTSPFMDTLAEEGVVFENTVTPRPKTTPSLASMLTGLYPYRHGVRILYAPMDEQDTLFSILGEQGFNTAAFVSNFVLIPKACGFDRYFDTYDANVTDPELNRKNRYHRNAGKTNLAVFDWLDENHGEPFFLWIHYIDPHGPYRAPEPFRSTFSSTEAMMAPLKKVPAYQRQPEIRPVAGEVDLNEYIAQYDNEIFYTDVQIGALVTKVRDLGLLEKSLFVVSSDHGESLYQHDYYFEHGRELYDDCSKIPLIMRFPSSHGLAGRRVKALTSIMDILPTVLHFLGVSHEGVSELDGVDLYPTLRGEPEVQGEVVIERHTNRKYDKLALRTAAEKLILYNNKLPECYDLARDPGELNPNACDAATLVDLATRLKGHLINAKPAGVNARRARRSEFDIEALRALGYIQD